MPVDTKLIRQALDVNAANLALGHEVFFAEGARVVRNRAFPGIRDANHVTDISASTAVEIDRLLARVDEEFEDFPHRMFHLDFRTPPTFEARLRLDGYERTEALVMVLETELRGKPRSCEIVEISSEADWAAYRALHKVNWAGFHSTPQCPRAGHSRGANGAQPSDKVPSAEVLAGLRAGGAQRVLLVLGGVEGVGQVENLFVHPDWRHRGLATGLIHRCVADARSNGAGPIVIVADPADTPKHMYAAMGWVPVAVKREYRRVMA